MDVELPVSSTPVVIVVGNGQDVASSTHLPLEHISGPMDFCAMLANDGGCHFEDGMTPVAKASVAISYGKVSVSDLAVGGTLFRTLHGLRKEVENPMSFSEILKIRVSYDHVYDDDNDTRPPFTKQGQEFMDALKKVSKTQERCIIQYDSDLMRELFYETEKLVDTMKSTSNGTLVSPDNNVQSTTPVSTNMVLVAPVDNGQSTTPVLMVVKGVDGGAKADIMPIEHLVNVKAMAATLFEQFECNFTNGLTSCSDVFVELFHNGQMLICGQMTDAELFEVLNVQKKSGENPTSLSGSLQVVVTLPMSVATEKVQYETTCGLAYSAHGEQFTAELQSLTVDRPKYNLVLSPGFLRDAMQEGILKSTIEKLAPGCDIFEGSNACYYLNQQYAKVCDDLNDRERDLRRVTAQRDILLEVDYDAEEFAEAVEVEFSETVKVLRKENKAQAEKIVLLEAENEELELAFEELEMTWHDLRGGYGSGRSRMPKSRRHIEPAETVMKDVQEGGSRSVKLPVRPKQTGLARKMMRG